MQSPSLRQIITMRSQHIAMPIEEFRLMPWKLGWKYEYWDGQAHITPREQIVTVTVEVTPHPIHSRFRLRPVETSDAACLIEVYFAAFRGTIEYCDWKSEKVVASANDNIRGFFSGKSGKVLLVSRLAVDVSAGEEHLTGAALAVAQDDGSPLLRLLFVRPEYQRQGLATTLVSAVMNELHKIGVKTLTSRYMLGNESSQAWHRTFGFVEEPDLSLARLLYHHASHEFRRHEQLGGLSEKDQQALMSEKEYWKSQVDELQRIADQNGLEAVLPLLRGRT
jgi:GNAT superfamily N-acetyltransferase